jgi:hypothetical protein
MLMPAHLIPRILGQSSPPVIHLYHALFGDVIVCLGQEPASTLAEAVVFRELGLDVSLESWHWEQGEAISEKASDRSLPLLGKVYYDLPSVVVCVNFLRGV